jgi:hypothetical protein
MDVCVCVCVCVCMQGYDSDGKEAVRPYTPISSNQVKGAIQTLIEISYACSRHHITTACSTWCIVSRARLCVCVRVYRLHLCARASVLQRVRRFV